MVYRLSVTNEAEGKRGSVQVVPGGQAVADLLEINGINTTSLLEIAAYEAMIRVAKHELDRLGC
jgi:hypothetical protein